MKRTLPELSAQDLARLSDLSDLASDLECAHCGQPYEPTRERGGKPQRFCSRQCQKRYNGRKKAVLHPIRGQRLDLTGQRFGSLVALEEVPRPEGLTYKGLSFRCVCDCGEERVAPSNALRQGITISCVSCGRKRHGAQISAICREQPERYPRKAKDLTGQRFGRLVVLGRATKNKGRIVAWLCRCDCGTECTKTQLTSKTRTSARSCGCLLREKTLARFPRVQASLRTLRAEGIEPCQGTSHTPPEGNTRFGSLRVIRSSNYGEGPIVCDCICDCGKRYRALARRLRNGITTRCRSCAAKGTQQQKGTP